MVRTSSFLWTKHDLDKWNFSFVFLFDWQIEQAIYHTPGLPSSNPAFPSSSPYSNPAAGIHAPIPPPGPYAPPPGGVYQSPPVATQYVITTQSLIYGDVPLQCQCPNCHQVIVTRIEKRSGLVSWLACGGILLFGCWLGCCLIPFCVDSFKVTRKEERCDRQWNNYFVRCRIPNTTVPIVQIYWALVGVCDWTAAENASVNRYSYTYF